MTQEHDAARIAAEDGMPVGDKVNRHNERFPFAIFSERWAQRNHYQTLRRLAERGGLVWSEAAAIIQQREWQKMDGRAAEDVVRAAVRNELMNERTER